MFKIGYFRSSYNDGGINRKLEMVGAPSLYEIFPHSDSDYSFQPNWEESRAKAKEALDILKSKDNGYEVTEFSANIFTEPTVTSAKQALEIFNKELERNGNRQSAFGGSYSNRDGNFFLNKPLEVVAVIPGTTDMLGKRPTTYVIYKSEGANWYLKALEIVIETCEYVLAQKDSDKYWLHWSG